MREARSPIFAELDRVGASFRKAGAADYISATFRSDGVKTHRAAPRAPPTRMAGAGMAGVGVAPGVAG
jgi:hypothetical protein